MGICNNNNSLFGNKAQHIKFSGGDIVAIQGSNTMERLMLGDLRIPYRQILKSRVILKQGQVNYLLNHLGLGDNATFLAIKATYNQKSVNEEDNFINWNFFDNFSNTYQMKEVMVLTGNSTNRIKQIYLTNPNTKYPVILDIMVAVIDDEYSFFNDTVNQVGLALTGLTLFSIETNIPNQSIIILDNNMPRKKLTIITLSNIDNLERIDKILIVNDILLGKIFLEFNTDSDAKQANSLINFVINNQSSTSPIIIQELDPREDIESPIIYFNEFFNGDLNSPITGGTYSPPLNTSMGISDFGVTISLSDFPDEITKEDIISGIISSVEDNRDGILNINSDNIIIYTENTNVIVESITQVDNYIVNFLIEDIAGNEVDININFKIIVE